MDLKIKKKWKQMNGVSKWSKTKIPSSNHWILNLENLKNRKNNNNSYNNNKQARKPNEREKRNTGYKFKLTKRNYMKCTTIEHILSNLIMPAIINWPMKVHDIAKGSSDGPTKWVINSWWAHSRIFNSFTFWIIIDFSLICPIQVQSSLIFSKIDANELEYSDYIWIVIVHSCEVHNPNG